jgi:uncharacterized protein YbjT (DUF2867 family)
MTILVTGATGTIGSHLVNLLTQSGTEFYTMSSKPGTTANARLGDFNSVESLTKAFNGIDTLFVLLPLVGNKLELAKNVATAAKTAGVKHIVRSSGAGADSSSSYALPRLQGQVDDALRSTGITTTFLQPAGFMQNYATFQVEQVKQGVIYAAHADAKKSMVDTRDIAAVAAKILQNPAAHANKSYVLTSNDSLTEQESAAILSSALGKSITYQAISLEAAEASMKEWGLPSLVFDAMASLNKIVSAGYAAGTTGDVKTILGREPISFAQFASEYASHWVGNGGKVTA